LVYDLGGGTFDVSIVQIEQGVVEVLASHGDTHLGGDDFDQLLLDHVCDEFADQHGMDLREIPVAKSRLLQAVEMAKIRLSDEAYTTVTEEFIAEKNGKPLNLTMEIDRLDYEAMIEPLLAKTVRCVDAALADARLQISQIDKIILVGGSSRTPMVHRLLEDQLAITPHLEVDPDMCVAMGAEIQGALISGLDVGPVLVDITPHTLGVQVVGLLHGHESPHLFSPIITRNTPLPASRSEIYYTGVDGQEKAEIHVLQGEHEDARHNETVGKFMLEGLDENAEQGNEVLVRFELNLDGILTVTAVERNTSLERRLTIDNAVTRFRAKSHDEAKTKLAELFIGSGESTGAIPVSADTDTLPDSLRELIHGASELVRKAQSVRTQASSEDAREMQALLEQLQEAIKRRSVDRIRDISTQLEDLVFYLEDA
jgi:molecular chaperone DnaK